MGWKSGIVKVRSGAKGGRTRKQHEITAPLPPLDDAGNLTQPGWARKRCPVCVRAKGKGARWSKAVLDAGTEIE